MSAFVRVLGHATAAKPRSILCSARVPMSTSKTGYRRFGKVLESRGQHSSRSPLHYETKTIDWWIHFRWVLGRRASVCPASEACRRCKLREHRLVLSLATGGNGVLLQWRNRRWRNANLPNFCSPGSFLRLHPSTRHRPFAPRIAQLSPVLRIASRLLRPQSAFPIFRLQRR